MSGPGPSTVVGEPPDAPPTVSGATGPGISGDAAVASSLGVPDLPSSQEELDVPLSALLGTLSGHPVGSAREGEEAGPPGEKRKQATEKVVSATTSPRFTRFLPDFAETFIKLESSRENVQGGYSFLFSFSSCYFHLPFPLSLFFFEFGIIDHLSLS